MKVFDGEGVVLELPDPLVATKVAEVETFTKAMQKRTRDRAERYPGLCDL